MKIFYTTTENKHLAKTVIQKRENIDFVDRFIRQMRKTLIIFAVLNSIKKCIQAK
ncbi:hypothetical protein [Taibaiella soli]|uniref:hypothetical protein n=1 Tax=Taibaiella soli TaxID=1649169 RepID=UPI001403A071|nr:hypothetical protein [Taibaiella soli]